MKDIANDGEQARDPGEDRVTTVLQKLGITVDFSISAMDCYDPAPQCKHIGLSFVIQARMLEQYSEWFSGFFSRVKEASRAAMGRRLGSFIGTGRGNYQKSVIFS